MVNKAKLLKVDGLSKWFRLKAQAMSGGGTMLRAVHNVSFSLGAGRTLGLVGESGCGKSTTGRLVLRLIEPSAGSIKLLGEELTSASARRLKKLRSEMQIIFQDPLGSLNPRLSVKSILREPLQVHGVPRSGHMGRVYELLNAVELPRDVLSRYPHEFSGGQRQRIAIARALALKPKLIVADEPVSALDASIQSQILLLLKRLQEEQGLAFLFISHDLAVVRFLCHEVAVMYLGEIVEHGPIGQVYASPAHPYTRALMAAIPDTAPDAAEVEPLGGQLPSATNPPPGCAFASRCDLAGPACMKPPPVIQVGDQHHTRCWLHTADGVAAMSEVDNQTKPMEIRQ